MKLTEICISRPVLSTVLSMVLVIIGGVSYSRLQVRQYPKIDYPVISVRTPFVGAGPDIIETQITKPLENALMGINGIDTITSESGNGESKITMQFKVNRDIEDAANDVRDKVNRGRAKFQSDISPSEIQKSDADAVPMISLVLFGKDANLNDMNDYAENKLKNQLQVVPGVAAINIYGGGEYKMYIRLDPLKMANLKIAPEDISKALKEQTFEKPAGYLTTEEKQITVTTKAALKTEEQFANVVIEERDGYLIRIRDVAKEVKFDAVENLFHVRFNGQDAVVMEITRQSTANDLDISRAIRKLLPKMQRDMPKGMNIDIANDKSVFIERSIHEVYWTILEATLLVILVIFVFLRSVRASLIPIVTIPLSLIGTFAIMTLFGFSVNILTLLAIVMAIGLVVDDAIVILENIYRYIEEGMEPLAAAYKGSKEIGNAIVAMTITLAAVYLPVALSSGTTGKLFTEFAVTLAGAVLLSGFIALTLSPMMCGRFLKPHVVENPKSKVKHNVIIKFFKKIDYWIDYVLNTVDVRYASSLQRFSRIWIIFGGVAVATLGGIVAMNMKQDMSTPEDQGTIAAKAYPPKGASLEFINKYMIQAEKMILANPEVDKLLSMIQTQGDTTFRGFLIPWEDRKRSSTQIADSLRPQFEGITGLSMQVNGAGRSLTGGGKDQPVQLVVQSTKSYEELIKVFTKYASDLGKLPGIDGKSVRQTNIAEEQEYVIKIDREKAAALNVDVIRIGETLESLIGGRPVVYFENESIRYPVNFELEKEFRKTREDIKALYVRSTKFVAGKGNQTTMIPLSEIVSIERQLAPPLISHVGGLRALQLWADLAPGYGLKDVLTRAEDLGYETLPKGSTLELAGESKKFFEESANVFFIFLLAVVFIYLVLSAQYESFIDPLIIMVSVPLSLVGGIITLLIMGGKFKVTNGMPVFETGTLTLFAKIGLVTLIGLITKHGILIVEFANQLLSEGQSRAEAVVNAARTRLRPILMTTFAMVLGAIPLALASGPGSESRQQIGWVIVGGMSIGTVFTLYVLPAVYVYLTYENLRYILALEFLRQSDFVKSVKSRVQAGLSSKSKS
jgi:multidrug efflux pump